MNRKELEHIIRAAAALTDEYEIMVLGSQSILGAVPEAPAYLLQSMEADIYPLHRPDLADVIDGAIGELSPFVEVMLEHAIIDGDALKSRIGLLPLTAEQKARLEEWVSGRIAKLDMYDSFQKP